MPIDKNAVKRIMIAKMITNKDLAEKLDITEAGVSNLINKPKNSSPKTINNLANALEVNPLDIIKE